MSRSLFLPVALAVLLQVPADALAQVTLKLKFEEGTKFKDQETQKVDQVLKLNGMELPTKAETKMTSSTTYGKRDAEGNLPVSTKIETLLSDLTLPGGLAVHFDSAKPDQKAANPLLEPILDRFRKIPGMVITHTMSRDNKVLSVERPKQETELDPEELKEAYQQALDMLPTEPIKAGDKWERTVKQDLGQGQVFTFKRSFEYAGLADEFATVAGSRKLDKITATDSSVVYSTRPNAGMALNVKKSDLKVESSKHTYLFDRSAGRMVDVESAVRVKGELSLSANNMNFDGDLDLTLAMRTQEVK